MTRSTNIICKLKAMNMALIQGVSEIWNSMATMQNWLIKFCSFLERALLFDKNYPLTYFFFIFFYTILLLFEFLNPGIYIYHAVTNA